MHRIRGRRHVSALCNVAHAALDELLGGFAVELVLGCTRQCNISLDIPDIAALVELHAVASFLGVGGDALAAHFLDIAKQVNVHAVRGGDVAGGVRHGNHGSAEFLCLCGGVDGNVTGAGHDDLGAVEGLAVGLHHFFGDVNGTETGGLGTYQGTAPGQALAGQDAGLVLGGQAAELAEEEADFAAADADIAGRNVAVLADVAVQLGHEGLAEAHNFLLGLALRVKVGATLAATDGQAGQGVFKDLLKAQELNNAQVYRGVETQATLVRSERGVELHTEAAVDLHLAVVINPWYAEDELALRFAQALNQTVVCVVWVLIQDDLERIQHLGHRLVEFRFTGVTLE